MELQAELYHCIIEDDVYAVVDPKSYELVGCQSTKLNEFLSTHKNTTMKSLIESQVFKKVMANKFPTGREHESEFRQESSPSRESSGSNLNSSIERPIADKMKTAIQPAVVVPLKKRFSNASYSGQETLPLVKNPVCVEELQPKHCREIGADTEPEMPDRQVRDMSESRDIDSRYCTRRRSSSSTVIEKTYKDKMEATSSKECPSCNRAIYTDLRRHIKSCRRCPTCNQYKTSGRHFIPGFCKGPGKNSKRRCSICGRNVVNMKRHQQKLHNIGSGLDTMKPELSVTYKRPKVKLQRLKLRRHVDVSDMTIESDVDMAHSISLQGEGENESEMLSAPEDDVIEDLLSQSAGLEPPSSEVTSPVENFDHCDNHECVSRSAGLETSLSEVRRRVENFDHHDNQECVSRSAGLETSLSEVTRPVGNFDHRDNQDCKSQLAGLELLFSEVTSPVQNLDNQDNQVSDEVAATIVGSQTAALINTAIKLKEQFNVLLRIHNVMKDASTQTDSLNIKLF